MTEKECPSSFALQSAWYLGRRVQAAHDIGEFDTDGEPQPCPATRALLTL
jgi:hypothetical protein